MKQTSLGVNVPPGVVLSLVCLGLAYGFGERSFQSK